MAAFLPGGASIAGPLQQPSLLAIGSCIQTALLPRLGMEGPRLVKLMQVGAAGGKLAQLARGAAVVYKSGWPGNDRIARKH